MKTDAAGAAAKNPALPLSVTDPWLASQWHPTRNGELRPTGVTGRSGRKVWWCDSLGHEWDAIIANRSRGTGCPFCANRKVLPGFNDLATTDPQLAAEWHPTKNGTLHPTQITAGGGRKVWWQDELGHQWEAMPVNRSKGTGCPLCNKRRSSTGPNDLATVNPTLAAEWHPTRNGTLRPTGVTAMTNRTAWWQDALGHEWESSVSDRSKGSGCPYCAGKRILIGFNDLATVQPGLAEEWHPTMNGDLTPCAVTARSSRKVWWRDRFGHDWDGVIVARTNGAGCPACSGRDVHTGFNDLATVHPDMAAQWHPSKNDDVTPQMVTASSHTPAWWVCKLGHEWEASPNGRSGRGCPVCAGKRVLPGFNDLASIRPALATEWHPTRNGDLTPQTVTVMSGQRAWWLCAQGHEWESVIADHSFGYGCPVCANQKVLPGFNDLVTTMLALAAQWHPTRNGDLSPRMVTAMSGQRAWWLCAQGHEWKSIIASRARGADCPDCVEPGFKPGQPAFVYLLEHRGFGAYKVGITHVEATRLAAFKLAGWGVLHLEHFEVGAAAQIVEREVKRWWRSDLGMHAYLGLREMATTGGWTETIAADAMSPLECVDRIRTESVIARRLLSVTAGENDDASC